MRRREGGPRAGCPPRRRSPWEAVCRPEAPGQSGWLSMRPHFVRKPPQRSLFPDAAPPGAWVGIRRPRGPELQGLRNSDRTASRFVWRLWFVLVKTGNIKAVPSGRCQWITVLRRLRRAFGGHHLSSVGAVPACSLLRWCESPRLSVVPQKAESTDISRALSFHITPSLLS